MCLFYLDVRQLKLCTIATNGVDKIGISMTLNWFILNVVIIMIILSGNLRCEVKKFHDIK